MDFEKILLGILGVLCGLMVLGMIVAMLIGMIYFPAFVKAEKSCLELGYPVSSVTYDFEAYCQNLDGMVTYKIEKVQ